MGWLTHYWAIISRGLIKKFSNFSLPSLFHPFSALENLNCAAWELLILRPDTHILFPPGHEPRTRKSTTVPALCWSTSGRVRQCGPVPRRPAPAPPMSVRANCELRNIRNEGILIEFTGENSLCGRSAMSFLYIFIFEYRTQLMAVKDSYLC